MKIINKYLLSFLALSLSVSCGNKERKVPIYNDYDIDDTTEEYTIDNTSSDIKSGESIAVPFRMRNGVKYVPVKVNGVGFEMIFDTGCSGTLISVAEANYLYQKGKLTDDDIQGTVSSTIADGSIVENMVITLAEVVIDDKILCPNVVATVSGSVNAPLLLGNEVLDRLATITIDNERQIFYFTLK